MTNGTVPDVLHFLRRLGTRGAAGLPDGQLLDVFLTRGDEGAFQALVERHGAMVLGVCRRLLADPHLADDAFQATFLVLLKKARTLRRRELLANWLYGVAHRVALKARGARARRQARERQTVPRQEAGPDGAALELRPVIDEEVNRLPPKLRSPVVLCYLEGKTNEEAARLLRWPAGTVKSRLAQARDLLRRRLTRRGLALAAAWVPLAGQGADAAPAALADSVCRAAAAVAAGKAVAGAGFPPTVILLAEGVVRAMWTTKVKIAAALLLVAGAVGLGAGVAGVPFGGARAADGPAGPEVAAQPVAETKLPAARPAEDAGRGDRVPVDKPTPEKAEAPPAEKIQALVQQLGHDDFAIREAATKELVTIGRPAAAALRQALKSGDLEVRMRARMVLDSIQTALPHLIEDLKDKDATVRKEAAETLERLGAKAKEAVPALVEAIKDKDENVREAATVALISIDPDNKALDTAEPLKKATVNGKYVKLLKRLKVPQDKQSYTDFYDYGQYPATNYAGYNDIPAGYWVYVYPYWYIWGEMKVK